MGLGVWVFVAVLLCGGLGVWGSLGFGVCDVTSQVSGNDVAAMLCDRRCPPTGSHHINVRKAFHSVGSKIQRNVRIWCLGTVLTSKYSALQSSFCSLGVVQ